MSQTRSRRYQNGVAMWVLLSIMVLLAALTTYHAIDALLRSYHLPGDVALGLTASTDVLLSPQARAAQLQDATSSWTAYLTAAQTTAVHRGPSSSAAIDSPIIALLALDSVLIVPLYVLLLVMLIRAVRGWLISEQRAGTTTADADLLRLHIGDAARASGPRPQFGWSTLAVWAVVATAVANWVQNGVIGLLLGAGLAQHASSVLACTIGSVVCNLPVLILSLSVWLKAGGFLLVLVFLLSAGLLLLRHGTTGPVPRHDGSETRQHRRWQRLPGWWRVVRAVRLPLLALAIVDIGLSHSDQATDLIRRWADAPMVGAWSVLLTLVFAAALFLSSTWHIDAEFAGAPPGGRGWHLVMGLLVYAAGAFSLWFVSQTGGWGAKLLVTVLFAVLCAALVGLTPWRGVTLAGGGQRLPRWIGGLWGPVLLVVAAGLLLIFGIKALLPIVLLALIPTLNLPLSTVSSPPGLPTGDDSAARSTAVEEPPPLWKDTLPALLAAGAALLMGLAVLGVYIDALLFEWLTGGDDARPLWLLVYAVVFFALIPIVYMVGRRWSVNARRKDRTARRLALWVAGCLLLWLLILVVATSSPSALFDLAPQLGGVGLCLLALALMVLLITSLTLLVEQLVPTTAPFFRVLRLKRMPVVSFLVLWFLAASYYMPRQDTVHDVRVVGAAQKTVQTGETLTQAFWHWEATRCLTPSVPSYPTRSGGAKPAVPLILVATAGGGVRAAAWTMLVLDRVFGYSGHALPACGSKPFTRWPRAAWLFATSGVSGGSVGLATYAVHASQQVRPQLPLSPTASPMSLAAVFTAEEQTARAFQGDGIAPALAWGLFAEAPWSFLRYGLPQDRAAVAEETWQRAWWDNQAPDFFTLQRSAPYLPLLIFNGTSVESGCRFNASILKTDGRPRGQSAARCLAPGSPSPSASGAAPASASGPAIGTFGATVDLVDFLCNGQDLRLSTAALLSARFPYFSPSGHLRECRPTPSAQGIPEETYVADGGYLEGSGAATIIDVWDAIAPLVAQHNANPATPAYIVPYLIQIDNGYGEPAGPGAVPAYPQFIVPLMAQLSAAFSGYQDVARQRSRLLFSSPYDVHAQLGSQPACYTSTAARYVWFGLLPHPGPEAPLGWTLSSMAVDDLRNQLIALTQGKASLLSTVSSWDPHTLPRCV